MTKRKLIVLGLGALAAWGIGCGQGAQVITVAPPGGDAAAQAQAVVVMHTQRAVHVARGHSDGGVDERLFVKVRDFYPAACFDSDADGDGVPDGMDDDVSTDGGTAADAGTAVGATSNSGPGGGGDDDDDSDGGSGHGGDDDAGDDSDGGTGVADGGGADAGGGDDGLMRCRRCNRGPGNADDFRLRIDRDGRVELQRGHLLARSEDGLELTVPTPGGPLTLVVSEATRMDVDHGALLPGAEVRVRKARLVSRSPLRVEVEELEVLCPAPPSMPESELPEGATPLAPQPH